MFTDAERRTLATLAFPWSAFLKAHWRAIAASDFFTVEVWSWHGLVTHYVLFVIDLATRRDIIGGMTTNPNEMWMLQIARTWTDSESGALLGKRHLIVDRDTKFSMAFRTFLAREGVEIIRLPPRSPNLYGALPLRTQSPRSPQRINRSGTRPAVAIRTH